eukprot:TRINITY_DN3628_c0_g1_i1.p1 TRINITY_DN3628_c0_g1~~TRINITY_DN3628_c0_g1_i1.p1  ORF type:complete len:901 (-),score=181.19 TRINITY_DN3628_c0_g1_i1:161-2863(-)
MWVDPTPTLNTPHWGAREENEVAVLQSWSQHARHEYQQKRKDIDFEIFSFRIVTKIPYPQVVAVALTYEEIVPIWSLFKTTFLEQAISLDDHSGLWQFLDLKIASLVREQTKSIPITKNEPRNEPSNRLLADSLFNPSEMEQELARFACVLDWNCRDIEQERVSSGQLAISENSIVFFSNTLVTQIHIFFNQVTIIELVLSSDSIKITTTEFPETFHFTTFGSKTFQVYQLLRQLREKCQDLLPILLEEEHQIHQKLCGDSSLVLLPFQKHPTNLRRPPDLVRQQLLQERKNENYRNTFRLPHNQIPLMEELCVLKGVEKQGSIFISSSFVCYKSKDNELELVVPLWDVTEVLVRGQELLVIGTREYVFEANFEKLGAPHCWLSFLNKQLSSFSKKRTDSDSDSEFESTTPRHKAERDEPIGGLGRGFPAELTSVEDQFEEDYARTQDKEISVFEAVLFAEFKPFLRKKPTQSQEEKQDESPGDFLEKLTASHVSIRSPGLRRIVFSESVPEKLRGHLWQIWSGSCYLHKLYPHEYEKLLEVDKHTPTDFAEQIEKDLCRSFPVPPLFTEGKDVDSLRNILRAYATRNPYIGYCQSMNILGSVMKFVLETGGGVRGEREESGEEEGFWLLTTLCERSHPRHYLRLPTILGVRIAQRVLDSLVAKHLPQLHHKLASVIKQMSPNWFLCLFLSYFPLQHSLRILDRFFYEGPHTLYHLSLATFQLFHEKINKAEDHTEIVRLIRPRLNSAQDILSTAIEFLEEVTWAEVEALEHHHRFGILKRLHEKRDGEDSEEEKITAQDLFFVNSLPRPIPRSAPSTPQKRMHFNRLDVLATPTSLKAKSYSLFESTPNINNNRNARPNNTNSDRLARSSLAPVTNEHRSASILNFFQPRRQRVSSTKD